MKSSSLSDYDRIEKAISYLCQNISVQPSLHEVAESIHLSPYHFQRVFTRWAGVSPKKFSQYLCLRQAQRMFTDKRQSHLSVSQALGMSSTARLHDLFVKVEGMTPGEYKSGGKNLRISFNFASSIFGQVIVAATQKGLCYLAFERDTNLAMVRLSKRFPFASIEAGISEHQICAVDFINQLDTLKKPLHLHLSGTPFQLKVWESLLKIPQAEITCYQDIACLIKQPRAVRAVGSAIGANPVAYLIPCHRVIRRDLRLGGYRWGETRKSAMLAWEAAHADRFI